MKRTVPLEDYFAIEKEAKALVAFAFSKGPIGDIQAGKPCPTCNGNPEYSHITQAEMRLIMKTAVDRMYTLLLLKQADDEAYQSVITRGTQLTITWDKPSIVGQF
jgi:hypothetical protein